MASWPSSVLMTIRWHSSGRSVHPFWSLGSFFLAGGILGEPLLVPPPWGQCYPTDNPVD